MKINLKDDVNVIQMDLVDDLFPNGIRTDIKQETDLDHFFLLDMQMNSVKI